MTRWLLDTNVVSELRRPKPERKVFAFIEKQPLEDLYMSVVTLAEIRFGVETLAGRLMIEEGRTVRHTYSQPDLIIAATASAHGLTVVSRDTREFERAQVPFFNPWNDRVI